MRNETIRTNVRSLYDHQKLRIQSGNRIAAAFRVKLGLNSSQAEEDNEEAEEILKKLRQEYRRITDGIKRITKIIKIESPLISSYSELMLIEAYDAQLRSEHSHEKAIQAELDQEQIWMHWLIDVKGVGPLMAGSILSEIDITKCNSISALWAYCGLDVATWIDAETGEVREEGRGRKKQHLVPKQYENHDGEVINTVGISHNLWIKTKLLGVLAPSFLKQSDGNYRKIYLDYKHRLESHPKHTEKTKLHRHNMAMRYMIKEFLADLWTEWRTQQNLPLRSRYAEEKLGIVHHKVA